MKKVVYVLGIVIFVIIIGLTITVSIMNKNLDHLKYEEIKDIDLSNIKDGNYKGKYNVFPIKVELEVTVKDNKITDIDITKHENGQGTPAEKITEDVIEKQSIDVDTISGATYSSVVILKAIEDALK